MSSFFRTHRTNERAFRGTNLLRECTLLDQRTKHQHNPCFPVAMARFGKAIACQLYANYSACGISTCSRRYCKLGGRGMYARLDGSPSGGLESSPWRLTAHAPNIAGHFLGLSVIRSFSALFSRSRRSYHVGLFVLAILPLVDLPGTFRVGL